MSIIQIPGLLLVECRIMRATKPGSSPGPLSGSGKILRRLFTASLACFILASELGVAPASTNVVSKGKASPPPQKPYNPASSRTTQQPTVPASSVVKYQTVQQPTVSASSVVKYQTTQQPTVPANSVVKYQTYQQPTVPASSVVEYQTVQQPTVPASSLVKYQSTQQPTVIPSSNGNSLNATTAGSTPAYIPTPASYSTAQSSSTLQSQSPKQQTGTPASTTTTPNVPQHPDTIQLHPGEFLLGLLDDLSKKHDIALKLETYTDTKFGGLRVGEYRVTPSTSVGLKGVAATVKVLQKAGEVAEIYGIYDNAKSEFESRGITGSSLVNAWVTAPQSVVFAFENPDAGIKALTEGFTSASAVSIRFASFGLVEVHGPDVERFVNKFAK